MMNSSTDNKPHNHRLKHLYYKFKYSHQLYKDQNVIPVGESNPKIKNKLYGIESTNPAFESNSQVSTSPKSCIGNYYEKINEKTKSRLSGFSNEDFDEKKNVTRVKKRKRSNEEERTENPKTLKKRKKSSKKKKLKGSMKCGKGIKGEIDRNLIEKVCTTPKVIKKLPLSPEAIEKVFVIPKAIEKVHVTPEAIERVPLTPEAIFNKKKSKKKGEKHKRKTRVDDSQELVCSTEINELTEKVAVSPKVERHRKKKKSRKKVYTNFEKLNDSEKQFEGDSVIKRVVETTENASLKNASEDSSITTEQFATHTKKGKKAKKIRSVGKSDHCQEVDVGNSDHSQDVGLEIFSWMISPINPEDFFRDFFEKDVLLIKRTETHYEDLFSVRAIEKLLVKKNLVFKKNIAIYSYKDGEKKSCKDGGIALPPVVWKLYNDGCAIQLLNPQAFDHTIWKCLFYLKEYFNSSCEANVYLTPSVTQEFAPHWDDKENFILQLEGKKRWRVYNPRVCDEVLPRKPSVNIDPEDLLGDPPIIDCILESGDFLYIPRGFIQQEEAISDVHSLHITITTYHKNTYVDFFEKLLPAALAKASAEDVNFRKGLPKKYLNFFGAVHSENRSNAKEMFVKCIYDMYTTIWKYCSVDDIADQMAKRLIKESLPPPLTKDEMRCSGFDGGKKWYKKRKYFENVATFTPDTNIRLLRQGCVRLVVEENSVRLYHSLDNSLKYRAENPKYIEVHADSAPGVEALILSYPKYITVESLPISSLEDKLVFATMLCKSGLITTSEPLSAPTTADGPASSIPESTGSSTKSTCKKKRQLMRRQEELERQTKEAEKLESRHLAKKLKKQQRKFLLEKAEVNKQEMEAEKKSPKHTRIGVDTPTKKITDESTDSFGLEKRLPMDLTTAKIYPNIRDCFVSLNRNLKIESQLKMHQRSDQNSKAVVSESHSLMLNGSCEDVKQQLDFNFSIPSYLGVGRRERKCRPGVFPKELFCDTEEDDDDSVRDKDFVPEEEEDLGRNLLNSEQHVGAGNDLELETKENIQDQGAVNANKIKKKGHLITSESCGKINGYCTPCSKEECNMSIKDLPRQLKTGVHKVLNFIRDLENSIKGLNQESDIASICSPQGLFCRNRLLSLEEIKAFFTNPEVTQIMDILRNTTAETASKLLPSNVLRMKDILLTYCVVKFIRCSLEMTSITVGDVLEAKKIVSPFYSVVVKKYKTQASKKVSVLNMTKEELQAFERYAKYICPLIIKSYVAADLNVDKIFKEEPSGPYEDSIPSASTSQIASVNPGKSSRLLFPNSKGEQMDLSSVGKITHTTFNSLFPKSRKTLTTRMLRNSMSRIIERLDFTNVSVFDSNRKTTIERLSTVMAPSMPISTRHYDWTTIVRQAVEGQIILNKILGGEVPFLKGSVSAAAHYGAEECGSSCSPKCIKLVSGVALESAVINKINKIEHFPTNEDLEEKVDVSTPAAVMAPLPSSETQVESTVDRFSTPLLAAKIASALAAIEELTAN